MTTIVNSKAEFQNLLHQQCHLSLIIHRQQYSYLMNQNQKLGDKKFKAGKQNVTTGIFQWSKDYLSGSTNFAEAVKFFKTANAYKKAIDALKELIVCNEKLLDNWAVARNYEQMLQLYVNHFPQTSIETLKQTAHSGFQYFRMAESVDKGVAMLSKVANILIKRGEMKEGVEILKTTYETIFEDEKSFKKKELFNQIIQAFVETGVYSQVERMYHNLIKRDPSGDNHQNGLIILVSILIQHEAKRAEKEMYELSNLIPNWLESDECQAADELIKAYKKGDTEKFLKWTTKAAVTSIYPVIFISKLRDLNIPSASANEQEKGENGEGEKIKELLF